MALEFVSNEQAVEQALDQHLAKLTLAIASESEPPRPGSSEEPEGGQEALVAPVAEPSALFRLRDDGLDRQEIAIS
jgi:hypothetical protein